MNGYDLSRQWFDFAFENPDRISGNHAAVYLWNVELNNRLGWVSKFASPTNQAMAATGIKSYNTYKKIFDDLVSWGFIKLIQESKNQYSANIIALSKIDKALDKALDEAVTKQLQKQCESTVQSTCSINKPINQETNKPKNSINVDFDVFWNAYDKKIDKTKAEKKWNSLTDQERQLAIEDIPKYLASLDDRKYQKNPLTYLNGECWKDERQNRKVLPIGQQVKINKNSFV